MSDTPETDEHEGNLMGCTQPEAHFEAMTDFARKLERERNEAKAIIEGLLSSPYPHDLMAIRREAQGYDSETSAMAEMDVYCTEEALMKARADWKAAESAAREWLKNNTEL